MALKKNLYPMDRLDPDGEITGAMRVHLDWYLDNWAVGYTRKLQEEQGNLTGKHDQWKHDNRERLNELKETRKKRAAALKRDRDAWRDVGYG